MSKSAAEYLRSLTENLFVAQFMLTISVDDGSEPAFQNLSYLIPAPDEHAAREIAERMVPSLADVYRNKNGDVVDMTCIGLHGLEPLDYPDLDGTIPLSRFMFSNKTSAQDLIDVHNPRNDLPNIDQ